MSFLLKDGVRGTTIESIYNDLFSGRGNFYYFIGKILPYDDPFNPDTPLDTQYYEYETRNEILTVKKITAADASFVVPRINWISGTVYDQFDGNYSPSLPAASGATNLRSAKFYVLSTAFNVYKCIFNNNEAASTFEPSGTDLATITTADGYIWKYLYTIPLSSRNKFFSENLMPVQRSVQNPFYSNGEIDRIIIESKGSGYFGNSEVTLEVVGTFASNVGNTIATIVPVFDIAGSILDVKIRNPGNNYSTANIVIVDNASTGSSLYKSLINVSLTNPGSGYVSNVQANTSAVITTTGTQPSIPAIVSIIFGGNAVVGFGITNPGSGYTPVIASNTTIAITTTGNAQPTSNATATLSFATTAILTPRLLNGRLNKVSINDPGVEYRSNIQTTIATIGDGSNVSLLPFINSAGELEDVIIVSRGEGFTFLDIEVIGDGIGANASAQLSTGDLDTNQSSVELSAIDGAIHAMTVFNIGSNYTVANVSIIGDGTGFDGTVVLSNANTITSITVNNPGVGYSFANVIITGNGSNANVSAIISPPGGHGRDAVRELFANTILFFSTINNERIHGVDVNNDYRQFGIIKDIKQFGNQRAFANATGTSAFLVTLNTLNNSLSQLLEEDVVLQVQGETFREFQVVDIVASNTQALLKNVNNFNLTAGTVLVDPITSSNFTVISVDQLPTINKFSGDLFFIDNRTKVSYSDQQLVTLKTSIKL